MSEHYSHSHEHTPTPPIAEVPTKDEVLATVGLILEAVRGTDVRTAREFINSRMPEVQIAGLIAFARAVEGLPHISKIYTEGATRKANEKIGDLVRPKLTPEDYDQTPED